MEQPVQRGPQRSKMIFGSNNANTQGAELTTASFNGDIQLINELITTRGFDVNAMDKRTGRNALHEACITGNDKVVRCLFDHGCNVHTRTMLGRESCLHLAAQHGHDLICKMLLKRGIKPDRLNGQGLAPLHLTRRAAVCYVIINHGGDPFVKTRDGVSAITLAIQRKDFGVEELLNERLHGKMREQSRIERLRIAERKEHYLKMQAEHRLERKKQEKKEAMRQYLKFRWQ
jgi:ankyrin repeat protein